MYLPEARFHYAERRDVVDKRRMLDYGLDKGASTHHRSYIYRYVKLTIRYLAKSRLAY